MKGNRLAICATGLVALMTGGFGQSDDWLMSGHDVGRTSDSLSLFAPPLNQGEALPLPNGPLQLNFVIANGDPEKQLN